MKIAIMQPYFFPYDGYFELIKSVDVFVFLNDVQYIRRGWVNRNRIKSNHKEFQYITVPVKKAPQQTPINQIKINHEINWRARHLKSLLHIYGKKAESHPVFQYYAELALTDTIYPLLKETIIKCCEHLQIQTNFMESSQINCKQHKSANRILHICKELGATTYVNANKGSPLYSNCFFNSNGVELEIMPQNNYKLSILDHLFSEEPCNSLLTPN